MNLQRLQFAWARGAKIQWLDRDDGKYGVWYYRPLPAWDENHKYRIHPDDEHLAYGPLSAALIDSARHEVAEPLGIAALEVATLMYSDRQETGSYDDWVFFYLFVAELLADEGL